MSSPNALCSSRALFIQSCPCPMQGTTEGTRARLPIFSLASGRFAGYGFAVAANSATGLGNPISKRRNSAPNTIAGAFFTSAFPFYGGCAWETLGSAGFLLPRFTNPRTAATHSLGNECGSSSAKGATPMLTRLFALSPSEVQRRAERHRARAVSQLKSKSSLKVRHERYNSEMARARFFESLLAGGAQ